MSSYPYNMKCSSFNNFFFNVANWDNGRSWSTKWVIDDPQIFVIPPKGQTASNLYRNRGRTQQGKQMTRSRSTSPSTPSKSRTPSSASKSGSNSQR